MRGDAWWISVLGALAVPALPLLTAAPSAAATDGGWQLRVAAPWVESGLDYRRVEDGVRVQLLGQAGHGLGLALERRVSDRLGWELGLTWSRNEVDLWIRGPGRGNLFGDRDQMTPLTLTFGPDIHLTPGSRADLYFGPVVAYVLNDDIAFETEGKWAEVAVDDGFAWGGLLGLDYPLGGRGWYLCGSVRYLEASADALPRGESSEALSLAVDPLMVAVGFGYRFSRHPI